MKRPSTLASATLVALAIVALPADAWIRGQATTFATLPTSASLRATPPEGITVDPAGNVYVSTFGFPESGESQDPGQVIVFDAHGNLLNQFVLAGASPHLLGLAFRASAHDLLVLDFGAAQVLKVDPVTGASSVFADIGAQCTSTPGLCPGSPGLNALTFDSLGNVYVSDSFQGFIWRIGPNGGAATVWASDPLLTTTGKPPFGANGLAFNNSGTILFVANTGDDSVVQIPVSNGAAGTASVFAYSINGADGLAIDQSDNIWVVANQSDEIVVIDPKDGKAIAKLGDFDGIDNNGAVRGLLFPASLVFSGNSVLVTNLVLDLEKFFGIPTVDSDWAAKVSRYTVSRINRTIPPIHAGK